MFVNQSSCCFIPAIVLLCLPIFLGEPWLGEFRLHEWLAGEVARGEGPYPAGGVGYPWLVLLHPLAARVPCKFTQNLGRGVLSTSVTGFSQKNGTIFFGGGCPP
jgi:hypothetical protein